MKKLLIADHEKFNELVQNLDDQSGIILVDVIAQAIRESIACQVRAEGYLRFNVSNTSAAQTVSVLRKIFEISGEPLHLLAVGWESYQAAVCSTMAAIGILEAMLSEGRTVSVICLSSYGGFTCDLDDTTGEGLDFDIDAWGSMKPVLTEISLTEQGSLSSQNSK